MAFGIDDIVESALGPWGLVLGLGVGALVTRREKLLPALAAGVGAGRDRIDDLSAAGSEKARASKARLVALNASGAEKVRSGVQKIAPAAAGLGGGVASVGHLAERARSINVGRASQSVLTGLTRSWSELYAEAKAEFEASHPNRSNAVWVHGERVDDLIQPHTPAQRDSRGRFIKRSDDDQ